MIWYFLGGAIAGAVGMVMLAEWWVRKKGLDGSSVHQEEDDPGD